MEQAILNLAENGWNIANGVESPIAWLDEDAVTDDQLLVAHIATGTIVNKCLHTGLIYHKLDYPKSNLKSLLISKSLLPKNYNELELIAKFIK